MKYFKTGNAPEVLVPYQCDQAQMKIVTYNERSRLRQHYRILVALWDMIQMDDLSHMAYEHLTSLFSFHVV